MGSRCSPDVLCGVQQVSCHKYWWVIRACHEPRVRCHEASQPLRLPRKIGDKHIVKFSEGPCSADVKSDNRRGDQSCAGLFVELVKQPQLGLVHQETVYFCPAKTKCIPPAILFGFLVSPLKKNGTR